MKPGMSSCLTRTSLVSGLTSRIWPWSWYCLVGGVRLHAVTISIPNSKRRIPYTLNVRKRRVQKDPPSSTEKGLDDLDRHLWLQLSGMEGQLLSREAAIGEDAAVLRRALFNR